MFTHFFFYHLKKLRVTIYQLTNYFHDCVCCCSCNGALDGWNIARDPLRLISIFPHLARLGSANLIDIGGVEVVCTTGLPVAVEGYGSLSTVWPAVANNTLTFVTIPSRTPRSGGSNFIPVGCVEMIFTAGIPVAKQGNRPRYWAGVDVTLDSFGLVSVFSSASWDNCSNFSGIRGVEMVNRPRVPITKEGNLIRT